MFKVLMLQKFHGLSDEECEFQVKDRFSFMKFLELHPGDAIPDARTIWDFKQALERDGRNGAGRLFERFDQILTDGGMIGRKGSIVDASLLDEPRQRNKRKENEQIKGYRNHPLSEEDKKTNKGTSRIRARVEHVFGRMSQMAMNRLRTIGKERAHHHNGLSNLVYNMDRFAFLMR